MLAILAALVPTYQTTPLLVPRSAFRKYAAQKIKQELQSLARLEKFKLRKASEPCEEEVALDGAAGGDDGSMAMGSARTFTVTLEAYAAAELVVPTV